MTKTELMNGLSRGLNRAGLKLKKHSPEIMVVAGVVGMVTSTVMACKATTKAHDILEEAKQELDRVHKVIDNDAATEQKYSEEDGKKALAIVYLRTGAELAKTYAPAIAVGALSIATIFTSNHILRKRNVALASAYMIVDSSFKDYRKNVIERFGKDLDHELRYNVKTQTVEEIVVDEKGKEKKVENAVQVANPLSDHSQYARLYDVGYKGATKDPALNLLYLRNMQRYFNERLDVIGHVFLNEVYDAFGFPRTTSGQVVGWLKDNPTGKGDGHIDFDIYNTKLNTNFLNGHEYACWLDFNVDGPILELI